MPYDENGLWIRGHENRNLCKECGGACCKHYPGTAFPEDFGEYGEIEDNVMHAFRSGRWILDTSFDSNFPIVRPACNPISNYGRSCIFLSSNGCDLHFDERPSNCKMLEPGEKNCIDHGYSACDAMNAWAEEGIDIVTLWEMYLEGWE